MFKVLKDFFNKKPLINSEEDIDKSKHFCILPWIHTHLLPNGDILPCCVSDFNDPYGNVNEKSINEAWNSPKYNTMRRLMLSDRPVYSCSKCYELEESGIETMRKRLNTWFKSESHLLSETKPNGSHSNLKMKYLDLRFSNICNFKCRGCSPALSTNWYDDHQKLWNFKSDKPKLINAVETNPNLWPEIEQNLDHIKIAYFAGGEPLMMEEHYKCLEYLIAKGRTDIELQYNTNMSVLRFKKYNLIELWKKFKKINLSISLDDIEERGEYFRSGLNWNKFVENVKKIKEEIPYATSQINCTIQLFNIHRIPEIHSFLYENKLINEYGFTFNTLQDPQIYRTQVLPSHMKEKVKVKLISYQQKLKKLYPEVDWNHFSSGLMQQIEFMNSENQSFLLPEFKKQTLRLDEIRSESFETAYPELSELVQ